MWIRSQDKKMLIQVDCFTVVGKSIFGFQGPEDSEGVPLGKYENDDRAFDILNMLQNNCKRGFTTANMPQE